MSGTTAVSTGEGPRFTVFTPTYNRRHTLQRVFDSLRSQSFVDFEWLVVDDGSSDGTGEMISRWEREAHFPVRYEYQENQGKHVAFNRGVRLAAGKLFLTLDSDDKCLPDALSVLWDHWSDIPEGERSSYSAVTGLCVTPDGEIVGDRFPEDVMDSTPAEMRYRHGVQGEKWGFQRTDVLREHPFPEPEGMEFVPEDIVWDEIGRGYLTRFVNEELRVYHVEEESESDQLSVVFNAARHAPGLAFWHRKILDEDLTTWWSEAPFEMLRSAVHYARFSFHQGRGPLRQLTDLVSPWARLLVAVFLPVGWFVWLRDQGREAQG